MKIENFKKKCPKRKLNNRLIGKAIMKKSKNRKRKDEIMKIKLTKSEYISYKRKNKAINQNFERLYSFSKNIGKKFSSSERPTTLKIK